MYDVTIVYLLVVGVSGFQSNTNTQYNIIVLSRELVGIGYMMKGALQK